MLKQSKGPRATTRKTKQKKWLNVINQAFNQSSTNKHMVAKKPSRKDEIKISCESYLH